MAVKFWLFGAPKLEVDAEIIDITSTKAIALLAYLIIKQEPQTREIIATMFWGDFPQDRALANLRQILFKIRSYFSSDFLLTSRTSISIAPDADLWVDVTHCRQLLNMKDAPIETLIEACDLYTGEFLAGVNLIDSPDFDLRLQIQREELLKQVKTGYVQIVEQYHEQEDFERAINYGKRLVNLDPTDEVQHRRLMQLYLGNHQPIEAINQYHSCVKILDAQLEVSPGKEITRLYQQIIQSQDDIPTDFAARSQVDLLPPRPEVAIGRDKDLSHLHDLLKQQTQSKHPSGIAIQGWPGVGKSVLVALLAYDSHVKDFFPDGVLWTALGEHGDILASLSKWAQALGMENLQSANTSLEQITSWLRSVLRNRQMLLIVDDVWRSESAQHFRLGGENCVTVFTSRFNDVARQITASAEDIYKLDILDTDSALALLTQLAPDVVATYPDESKQLNSDLEGLPLALQVAGRLLQSEIEMGWGITDLLKDLRDGKALLTATAPADRFDTENQITPTVSALLEQSTKRLDETNRLRFALLGVFAPKPATFAIDALKAIWEVENPKDTIRLLVNRGLMEPAGDGRFQVHALLIAHAKSLFSRGENTGN